MTPENPPGNQTPPPASPAPPPVVFIWPRPSPQTIWPVVLGTIAIVVASVLIIGTLANAANAMLTNTTGAGVATQPAARGQTHGNMTILLDLCLAVLLLVGGIGLTRRMPAAVRLLKNWALLNIIYSVGSFLAAMILFLVAYNMGRQTAGWPSFPPRAMAIILFAAAGVFVSASPSVFVLVWFGRNKIKGEVASWTMMQGLLP